MIATLECGGLVELAEEFSINTLQIVETEDEFTRAVETVIEKDASLDFSILTEPKLPAKFGIKNVMRQYREIIYG